MGLPCVLDDLSGTGAGRFAQMLDGFGMLGGILIVLFGMALLQASLIAAQHPLL
jgi:hypothetical protein